MDFVALLLSFLAISWRINIEESTRRADVFMIRCNNAIVYYNVIGRHFSEY
jgi:hypothetical protein